MQHLRVEENPIMEMPHVEAASILLVGPSLKKFNDRGINKILTCQHNVLSFYFLLVLYWFNLYSSTWISL